MALLVIGTAALLVAIAFRLTAWGRRTSQWMQHLAHSAVGYEGARFSDFVGFAGFGLTIVTICLSWFTVTLQNRKSTAESQAKDIGDHIAAERAELTSPEVNVGIDFASHVDIHLALPMRNAHLIGEQVEFAWNYSKHNSHSQYLIELVKLDSSLPPTPPGTQCDFSAYGSCTFYANESTDERALLSLCPHPDNLCGRGTARAWEGGYIWRVVSAPASSPDQSDSGGEIEANISNWSEYSSFDVYPTLMIRMAHSDPPTILVGTTYSGNRHFSRVAQDGSQQGYDIDLIRLLTAGCLKVEVDEVVFDATRCYNSIAVYEDTGGIPKYPQQPVLQFIPYPSVAEGLMALRRKEIDVFIGSVTAAVGRENEGVVFTDGYFDFESSLYAFSSSPRARNRVETLAEWAHSKRSIGVIENSTNHWLATYLAAEPSLNQNFSIVAFPSYATLATAFRRRVVDGVLVDNTLGVDLAAISPSMVTEVQGLDRTSAWSEYHKRIGKGHEHLAIAVATAVSPPTAGPSARAWSFIRHLTDTESLPVDFGGLYKPLQEALAFADSDKLRCVMAERQGLQLYGEAAARCRALGLESKRAAGLTEWASASAVDGR